MEGKTVTIIGLGYVGLPTAIMLAERGFYVAGYDIDGARVRSINNRQSPIVETELTTRLQALSLEEFKADTAITAADYFIIAVPTPFNEDKTPNLAYIWQATAAIAMVLQQGNCIILESTVPVGTTDELSQRLELLTNLRAGIDFYFAHCPERVLPGAVFKELCSNPRVIGGINQRSSELIAALYRTFVDAEIICTSARAAEMVKLVENSSRDVALALAHQVAGLAEAADLDPYEIIALVNQHPRVKLLQPTCGVGGHCIAVDPWFLIHSFPEQTALLRAAREINDNRPEQVANSIVQTSYAWRTAHQKEPAVALLGLTYKPNTDDIRESPALKVARLVQQSLCDIVTADPLVNDTSEFNHVETTQALVSADIVVFLVAHDFFKKIPSDLLQDKVVLDFCGMNATVTKSGVLTNLSQNIKALREQH